MEHSLEVVVHREHRELMELRELQELLERVEHQEQAVEMEHSLEVAEVVVLRGYLD
jgi:hypothetical protein